MNKIWKKISTILLALSVVATSVPVTAMASEKEATNQNKNLEMNKTYIVPISRLDKYGLNIDWTATGADQEYGQDNVAQKALVTPKEDGTYSVTLQWASYDYLDAVQFYKQEKMTDGMQPKDLVMGTFNIPEKFKIDLTSSTRFKKYDYTKILKSLLSESENDNYYQNVTVKKDEEKDLSYITLDVSDINKALYFKAIETWKYGSYTTTTGIKDPAKDPDTVKQVCQECITSGGFKFDLENAELLTSTNELSKGNLDVQIERAAVATDLEMGVASSDETAETIKNMLKANVSIKNETDESATAIFELNDAVDGAFVADTRTGVELNATNPTANRIKYMYYMSRAYRGMNYNEISVSDNKFELAFSNDELAWGKIIKIVKGDEIYQFTLRVVAKEKDNSITFSSDGMTFTTTKENVNENAVFNSNPITSGTDYENIQSMLNGYSAKNMIYAPTFTYNDEKVTPTENVDVYIKIPDGWDTSKIKMYYLYGTSTDGSLTDISKDKYKVIDDCVVFNTNNLNQTYVISQDSVEANIKNLEDGLYSVDISSWNVTTVGEVSMSNAAIKRGTSYLYVKDGEYRVFFRLQGIYIDGSYGYCQRIYYKDNNGKKQQAEYLSYVTNDDDTSVYNVDYYGKNFGCIYPDSVTFPISSNSLVRGRYEIEFQVPIMDELGQFVPGSGLGARTAELKFYNLKKLNDSSNVPTYETSYLLKSIEDAEAVVNVENAKDIYDADTFAELTNKTKDTRTAYELMKEASSVNGDAILNASQELDQGTTEMLKTSLNKMVEKAQAVDSTKYTEASYNTMKDALEAAVVVANNSSATNADIEDALNKLYISIDGLAESNTVDKSTLTAKLAEAKEEVAKTEIYKPSSIAKLQSAIEAAQTIADSDTATQTQVDEQVTNLETTIKGLEKQVNKDALKEKYDEALETYNEGNADGRYNADAWAEFEKAVNDAKAVLANGDATESEVTAARTALFNTMNKLATSVDTSALNKLIAEAKATDTSNCTEKSVAALNAAIASAEKTVSDSKSSQDAIDKQYKLLNNAMNALVIKNDDANTVYDGTYNVFGRLWQATQDIPEDWKTSNEGKSMADPAINHTMLLTVKEGKPYLTVEFQKNTMTLFGKEKEGYLKNLWYFPGYTGTAIPTDAEAQETTVEDTWGDVTDDFNVDANGKQTFEYPRHLSFPLESLGQNPVYVKVFVPIMDSIQSGSGTQLAKLLIDWDSREQLTGIDTDKAELKKQIESAKELSQGDASNEVYAALQAALSQAEDVNEDLNVSQEVIDATTKVLKSAIAAMSEEITEVDKTELKEEMKSAKEILDSKDVVYTEATLEQLQTAYNEAKEIYDRNNASQNDVNRAVMNLKNAIGDLVKIADKKDLKSAMDKAAAMLKDTDSYTASALDALKQIYDQAKDVYNDSNASQDTVDAVTSALNYMVKHTDKVETTVDKDALAKMLMVASNMAGRESIYTADSLNNLKATIEAAQAVYDKKSATEEEVNAQVSALTTAIVNLEMNPSNSGSNNNGNNGNNGNNNNGDNNGSLDIKNLADGIYSITGNMVKVDKTTASMSDGAINHTVKLTVKNGKYYITLNFNGLTVGQKLGYLSQLKYFTTGYTLDKYGNPQGTLADVTVDSYQKNSDGSLVSDQYGTNYPDEVTFELIPEALDDGYVPLQVFVPIMDAISSGTGTQPVFLKLDWSSLKATTADDPDFDKNDNNGNNNNNNSNGNNNSSSLGNGSLGNNTLGSSSLGSSKLGSSSLGSGSSLKSGTSSLGSGSSLKSGTSSLGSGSSLKSASNVKTGDVVQNNTLWAAILLLGGVALLAGIMEYNRKKKANIK